MKMKKLKMILMVTVAASVAPFLCSCSNSDDAPDQPKDDASATVDLSEVFPYGVPQAGISNVTYNENGLVTGFTSETANVSFKYVNVGSRANDASYVVMNVDEGEGYVYEFTMYLNAKGYVSRCNEKSTNPYDGEENEQWWFDYNDAGQLVYMNRTEGGNEVTCVTYKSGDIVAVSMTSDEEGNSMLVAVDNTTIENKGGLMLFDECYQIDMDEMCYAYFAGLLGKATAHLPAGNIETYDGETYAATFKWTLNANGLPILMVSDDYEMNINW